MKYDFLTIERKWQEYWDSNKTFHVFDDERNKSSMYWICFRIHPEPACTLAIRKGYTATDILCRYRRMKGFAVLHPMGWDAFGLPAERYAMQTNIHPIVTTERTLTHFDARLKCWA